MEEALLILEQERNQNKRHDDLHGFLVDTNGGSDIYTKACQALTKVLQSYCESLVQPTHEKHDSSSASSDTKVGTSDIKISTSAWLYNLCSTIPSPLDTKSLASAILSACQYDDEMQVQAALFDTLGEGERAMEVLFEIVPRVVEIRNYVTVHELDQLQREQNESHNGFVSATSPIPTTIDPEQERLNILKQNAIEAAELAALTKAQADALKGTSYNSSSSHTHTITRASDKEIMKQAKAAAKAASKALAAAIEAGAIVDQNDIMLRGYDSSALAAEEAFGNMNNVALHKMNQEQFQQFQSDLLPEGTREYHEQKGLPRGTEREVCDGYEKVTIPAKVLSQEQLRSRIVISEVMNGTEKKAFEGTTSLNPMQSTVFEAAFNSNENLLICAPTGAGMSCTMS